MAFAPPGVNHEDNEDRRHNDKSIENQVGSGGGIETQVHDDILSIRNDAHQPADVAINPDTTTLQSEM